MTICIGKYNYLWEKGQKDNNLHNTEVHPTTYHPESKNFRKLIVKVLNKI